MSTDGSHLIRFLQQENIRSRDENKQLEAENQALRRYIRALQRVQSIIERFTPEHDILQLLDETLDCTLALLDAPDGSLMLVDEETDDLVFVLVHGSVREVLPGHRFSRKRGIAGWVAEHKRAVSIDNVYADPRFLPELDERFGFATRSLIAVPLIARGRVLGVIEAINKRSGEPFTEDDESLLSILATMTASALDYAASGPHRVDNHESVAQG
ncbi:MAG: GAF domain-containing protein [Chloroflexi bacterium]|nr:GAF domain-containing protein [Chloroflexota bacterium]